MEHLARSGYRVIALDLPDAPKRGPLHARALKRAGADVRVVDPRRIASLRASLEEAWPRAGAARGTEGRVFHLGFCSEEEDDLDRLLELEVEGTRNLLQAIQQMGRGIAVTILRTGLGTEKTARPPHRSPCLSAKDEQERTALSYAPGTGVTVLRATNILGPRAESWFGRLLLKLARLPLLPGILPPISLPVVHVEDLCRAALLLASKQGNGGTYACRGAGPVGLEQAVALLAEMTGKPRLPTSSLGRRWMAREQVQRAIRRLPLPAVQRVFEQAQEHLSGEGNDVGSLGFTLIHDEPVQIVRRTIQWYRTHGWITGGR